MFDFALRLGLPASANRTARQLVRIFGFGFLDFRVVGPLRSSVACVVCFLGAHQGASATVWPHFCQDLAVSSKKLKNVSADMMDQMRGEVAQGHGSPTDGVHASIGKSFGRAIESVPDHSSPLGEAPVMDILGNWEQQQVRILVAIDVAAALFFFVLKGECSLSLGANCDVLLNRSLPKAMIQTWFQCVLPDLRPASWAAFPSIQAPKVYLQTP